MSEREITLTPEIVSAIETVIAYSWEDERADFEDRCVPDEDGEVEQDPETHIFYSLRVVSEWIGRPI